MKKACLTVCAVFLLFTSVFSQEGSLVQLYGTKLVNDSLTSGHVSAVALTKKGLPGINVDELMQSGTPQKKVLLLTKSKKPVDLYFFPGLSNKKALIVGGIHGTELSAIEVANALVRKLSNGEKLFYNVVVIPCPFPDNATVAERAGQGRIQSNTGRYSSEGAPDPNRQMPCMGKPFLEGKPFDVFHRTIEPENRALLQFIQSFLPDRVLGIHAIRDPSKAGVFADPRTNCEGLSLGFETDMQLALMMAKYIQNAGGICPGNGLATKPTALYYLDPPIVPEGQRQPRSFQFPILQGQNRGVTLGTWASTAICAEDAKLSRPPIRTLTIEFPGYKVPWEYDKKEDQEARVQLIESYAASIHYYFLYSYFVEEDAPEKK